MTLNSEHAQKLDTLNSVFVDFANRRDTLKSVQYNQGRTKQTEKINHHI